MTFQRSLLPLILLVSGAVGLHAVDKQIPTEPHARVSFVPESAFYRPDRPIQLALTFKIQSGWHTYWTNPGTAGEAARVDWDLPKGWKDLGLRFPVPGRFTEEDVVVFGYENAVTLLDTLLPPPEAGAGPVRLTAHVSWLACSNVCVGEQKTVALSLRPGPSGPVPELFQEAEKGIPVDETGLRATLRRSWWGGWVLESPLPHGFEGTGTCRFIPENSLGVDFSKDLLGEIHGKKVRFNLSIRRNLLDRGRVEGIIQPISDRGGWRVSAAPEDSTQWLWVLPILLLSGWVMKDILKGLKK